jgi:hypothetical protein
MLYFMHNPGHPAAILNYRSWHLSSPGVSSGLMGWLATGETVRPADGPAAWLLFSFLAPASAVVLVSGLPSTPGVDSSAGLALQGEQLQPRADRKIYFS